VSAADGTGFSGRRLSGLVYKEALQVIRDPSAILVAFVLPVVMIFVFAFALSLDQRRVPIGVVMESDGAAAHSLAAAFAATDYFVVTPARDRREVAPGVVSGRLRGFVVIPQDFEARVKDGSREALVQIITDGSQPNTATFVAAYARGVVASWLSSRDDATNMVRPLALDGRFWFNPEINSRRVLIPGAIAIIMTLIGTLLTAMVVAREWDRGTMEALMSTPARVTEIVLGKLLPYFGLGLVATMGCALLATHAFGVPLRGTYLALLALAATFLVPALGQGLLISTAARNQLAASQYAAMTGFLPAFVLSGFLFEINSMPGWLQTFTYLLPARYFVASLQTVFLTGDVWPQFLPNMLAMLAIGALFFGLVARNMRKNLDG
jgi:ABC-2 type transport system permease protein